jgi:hypothetical protein
MEVSSSDLGSWWTSFLRQKHTQFFMYKLTFFCTWVEKYCACVWWGSKPVTLSFSVTRLDQACNRSFSRSSFRSVRACILQLMFVGSLLVLFNVVLFALFSWKGRIFQANSLWKSCLVIDTWIEICLLGFHWKEWFSFIWAYPKKSKIKNSENPPK